MEIIIHPLEQVPVAQEMVKALQVSAATPWKCFEWSPMQNLSESLSLPTIPSRIKTVHKFPFFPQRKIYPHT